MSGQFSEENIRQIVRDRRTRELFAMNADARRDALTLFILSMSRTAEQLRRITEGTRYESSNKQEEAKEYLEGLIESEFRKLLGRELFPKQESEA